MNFAVHLWTWLVLGVVSSVLCTSYYFGEHTSDSERVHREKVEYYAFPWLQRVQFWSYNDTLQRNIRAIDCYDLQRTEAVVNITEGGIGYPYVTMRLQSQRSYGLEYAIEIFA